jgi:hypothetical protein
LTLLQPNKNAERMQVILCPCLTAVINQNVRKSGW